MRRLAPAVMAVAAFGVVPACSGDSDGGHRLGTPSREQQQAYQACLAESGYTPEDFLPAEAATDVTFGADDLAAYRVEHRCAAESGIADPEVGTPEEAEAETEQAVSLVRCLRDRGWEVPDPEPSPIGDYLQPPTLPIPENREAAEAFMQDMTDCGEEAGIEVMGQGEDR